MVRRGKEMLIQAALSPLRDGGWSIARLTPPGVHPVRFTMSRGSAVVTVKLYIWNLSHGGRGRSDAEYRIQATGLEQFDVAPDEVTLILGWDDDFGVFAGFDVEARRDRLGASPSIQIQKRALDDAVGAGAAFQAKRDGEYAIAIRPDRLDRYIENLAAAHRGDLSAILTPRVEDADTLAARFDRLVQAETAFDFSRPDEALRTAVIARTEALLNRLPPNPVAPGQIGHNGPPGPIDDEEPDLRQTLEAVRAEADKAEPDGKRLARAGSFMAWISGALDTIREEAKALAEKGKELLREHVAKAIGGAVGGVVWNARDDIGRLLKSLLEVMLKWLESAAGLF